MPSNRDNPLLGISIAILSSLLRNKRLKKLTVARRTRASTRGCDYKYYVILAFILRECIATMQIQSTAALSLYSRFIGPKDV